MSTDWRIRLSWFKSLPRTVWVPTAITVLVLASALCSVTPLIDAETHRAFGQFSLYRSNAYVAFAPLCDLYDTLSLLSLWQHIALIVFFILCYVMWRASRWTAKTPTFVGRIVGEVWRGILALVVLCGVYAIGVLLPRPMARLDVQDPDLVAVDFHSHTNASWDGRHSFDAEANRQWHAAAGFNVAYISDHRSLAGARAAARLNPRRGGEGTVLLQGLEARDEDEHIIALHVDTTRNFDAHGVWHEPDYSTALARDLDASMLILSIPGNVRTLPSADSNGNTPFYAIELSDGSPKGIGQEQRDRSQILRLAKVLNLAAVAGSDNHGWGRTAIAWSILRIPGWRLMTPIQIDAAIQRTLRVNRHAASRVILRRSPDAGASWVLVAATPVTVPWTMLRTLSRRERASWILWGWTLWAVWTLAGLRATEERRVLELPSVYAQP